MTLVCKIGGKRQNLITMTDSSEMVYNADHHPNVFELRFQYVQ